MNDRQPRVAVITGAGHNVPQETPQAFVDAVLEVDGWH